MATKTKIKKPETLIEEVTALMYKHTETVTAILKDYSYATEESMTLELYTALERLGEGIDNLDDYELHFDKLLNKIKNHDDFDADEVFELLDVDDISHDNCMSLLTSLEKEDVETWATEHGYACIDLQGNMDNAAKLERFVTTEIYPHLNDQQAYLIL